MGLEARDTGRGGQLDFVIDAIDYSARLVNLCDADANIETVLCGPEVGARASQPVSSVPYGGGRPWTGDIVTRLSF